MSVRVLVVVVEGLAELDAAATDEFDAAGRLPDFIEVLNRETLAIPPDAHRLTLPGRVVGPEVGPLNRDDDPRQARERRLCLCVGPDIDDAGVAVGVNDFNPPALGRDRDGHLSDPPPSA